MIWLLTSGFLDRWAWEAFTRRILHLDIVSLPIFSLGVLFTSTHRLSSFFSSKLSFHSWSFHSCIFTQLFSLFTPTPSFPSPLLQNRAQQLTSPPGPHVPRRRHAHAAAPPGGWEEPLKTPIPLPHLERHHSYAPIFNSRYDIPLLRDRSAFVTF